MLTVLKVIGTILLWILRIIAIILGLVLLLILLLLFVPFRYKAEGDFDDGVDVKVKFSWLLHFINGYYIRKGDENITVVRIMIFKVYDSSKVSEDDEKEETDKKEKANEKPKVSNVSKPTEKKRGQKPTEKPLEEKKVEAKHSSEEKKAEVKKPSEEKKPENKLSSEVKKPEAKKKKKKTERKVKVKEETKEPSAMDKAKDMWAFLHEPENEGVLKFITKYVVKLLKWLLPRKVEVDMELGLEDPSVTGYIAAVTSILYVMTKKHIYIQPNFNEQVVKGHFKVKGRLYLYQPVYYIIRVILDKRVRRLYKKVRG